MDLKKMQSAFVAVMKDPQISPFIETSHIVVTSADRVVLMVYPKGWENTAIHIAWKARRIAILVIDDLLATLIPLVQDSSKDDDLLPAITWIEGLLRMGEAEVRKQYILC